MERNRQTRPASKMKRTIIRLTFFALFVLQFAPAFAQKTLTLEEVTTWALTNHPLATTANAVEQRGPAELLYAKSALDPKFSLEYDRKDFKGTEYFDYGTAELSWQSPYAVKVAGGYQRAEGTYLSDERFIESDRGQAYLAIKLPLLRGLLRDETRTGLKRGELAVERQKAMANMIRNELRYDVAYRYLEWSFAVRSVNLNLQIEDFIATRLNDYRGLVAQGDKPAVDTLEATVYLGLQRQTVRQAEIDAELARRALSELYWLLEEDDLPTLLPEEFVSNLPQVESLSQHPELAELSLALADASLARDLKREQLKPELNLNYYLLGDGFSLPETPAGSAFSEAYKLGITASYPLLNRKARAGVQLGQLKVIESEAKLNAKSQALGAKARAYRDAVGAYEEQLTLSVVLADQAERLLIAERELFGLGESTQFLINAREQAFLKARLGVVKLRFSRDKAVATYRYLLASW